MEEQRGGQTNQNHKHFSTMLESVKKKTSIVENCSLEKSENFRTLINSRRINYIII